MQILSNSTRMQTGLSVVPDKDAHDWCVVAVKGTFTASAEGKLTLAGEQRPLVTSDIHYGDPVRTSVRYESEFALSKPLTDVVIVGRAQAPRGKAVRELAVRLEVQGKCKDAVVTGDRVWHRAFGTFRPSLPLPFLQMPLRFERAYGGLQELQNPIGVGFHQSRSKDEVERKPLPNIEHVRHRLISPKDRCTPIGFGYVGRNVAERLKWAGTYDSAWTETCAPYLPADFDTRYFQGAPADQQFPHFRGGEHIRCVHMSENPIVDYKIPVLEVPVLFQFAHGGTQVSSTLDTVILEPHLGVAMLIWRAKARLSKKLVELRGITVGASPSPLVVQPVRYRRGKPVFRGLGEAVFWMRRRKGGR